MEEDEGNLVVLDSVGVLADDTNGPGVVGDDVISSGDPGTEETTALDTDAASTLITAVEEPVLQQEGRPVGEETVSLHLPKPHTASLLPPLDRLPGDAVNGPGAPHLVLVTHHVPQSLVVDDPEEDVGLHLDAVRAGVEGLRPVVVVARLVQLATEKVDGVVAGLLAKL